MCIKFAVIGNSRIFATLLKQEVIGRLAQLVQSICLTSRGSAVRIRQRPLHLPVSYTHLDVYKRQGSGDMYGAKMSLNKFVGKWRMSLYGDLGKLPRYGKMCIRDRLENVQGDYCGKGN